jgi:hypothetical protein
MTAGVSLSRAAQGRPVDMVLKKSISEHFEPSREFRRYMVLPGDSLYRIFRRFGIPDREMADYLRKFKVRNPSVENADLIRPGQVLMIPVFQQTTSPSRGHEAQAGQSSPGPGEELAGRAPPLPDKSRPSTPRDEAASLLLKVFTGMGGKIQRQGSFHFPMKDHGALTLDSERFPMIGLESGVRLSRALFRG